MLDKIIDILAGVARVIYNISILLDGKKTYIIALAIIAEGAIRKDMTTILIGLGMITGRSAIAKV